MTRPATPGHTYRHPAAPRPRRRLRHRRGPGAAPASRCADDGDPGPYPESGTRGCAVAGGPTRRSAGARLSEATGLPFLGCYIAAARRLSRLVRKGPRARTGGEAAAWGGVRDWGYVGGR